jgi:hypothetical protein
MNTAIADALRRPFRKFENLLRSRMKGCDSPPAEETEEGVLDISGKFGWQEESFTSRCLITRLSERRNGSLQETWLQWQLSLRQALLISRMRIG